MALWRFESGALGTDSVGGNDLAAVDAWPAEVTTGQREGGCCADFEADNENRLYRADADLDAGFPLQDGDTTKIISIACWFQLESLPGANLHYLFFKGLLPGSPLGRTSFALVVWQESGHYRVGLGLGYNYGYYYQIQWIFDSSIEIAAGSWYHLAASYQDSTKTWRLRIYDLDADESAFSSGVVLNNIVIDDWPIWLGSYYDGLLDEMVIFKDVLNPMEMAQIQQGIYDGPYSSSSSSSSSSQSSSSSSLSSSSESSWSLSSSSASSATARTWPTLSRGFDLEILGEIDDSGIGAADPQQGRVLTIPHFYRAVHRLRLVMRYLTQTDRVTLERFVLETTTGTVRTFEITHPKSGQTWLVRFDPESPPHWATEPKNMEKHRFEAILLEEIGDGYLTGVYL